MKVVSVLRFYHDKGAYRRETKSLQFCCEDVKAAWGRAIGFGDFDFERNMDNHVNMYFLYFIVAVASIVWTILDAIYDFFCNLTK